MSGYSEVRVAAGVIIIVWSVFLSDAPPPSPCYIAKLAIDVCAGNYIFDSGMVNRYYTTAGGLILSIRGFYVMKLMKSLHVRLKVCADDSGKSLKSSNVFFRYILFFYFCVQVEATVLMLPVSIPR